MYYRFTVICNKRPEEGKRWGSVERTEHDLREILGKYKQGQHVHEWARERERSDELEENERRKKAGGKVRPREWRNKAWFCVSVVFFLLAASVQFLVLPILSSQPSWVHPTKVKK